MWIRDSDIPTLRARVKCKARNNGSLSKEIRKVNFVIFVVNGLSVLKTMDDDGVSEKEYTKLIASAFKCPYLSFRGIRLCFSFFTSVISVFKYLIYSG